MKREFEKKILTVYDQIAGRDRTFKQGEQIIYVGHWKGEILEDFSVRLEDGTVLKNVIHNQPHKIKKSNS